ncbi:MAG TPA: nuclear transport factor 2 family protein [Gemmatimonadaceae bacterium]|nr:nuclear transport factor 2 family protein [Gemmatimonadaceae bacterium]
MHRLRWSVALVFLISSAAHSQTRAAKLTVAALEDAWIRAVIARDSAAFNRLLHPDFVYTEDDRVSSRAQLIRDVVTTGDTTTAGRNEDMRVRVHGNVAIVTGWLILTGRAGGTPFERRYRYTDTWVKVDGRWRVLAAQDYLKP